MTELLALARRHNLRIIEDASHAHGAKWRGRWCGMLGDIGVFSLQGDKLAPAGEGGVLLTDNDAYCERAVCLGDITRIIELESHARRFAATSFGIKTRMAPLSAAVARVQLAHLHERNRRRNQNLLYLSHALERLGLSTFLPPAHIERVYFEYLIRYDALRFGLPIESLIAALQAEGCQVSAPRYPLVHQQPIFTEGHWKSIARLDGLPGWTPSAYDPGALPRTQSYNGSLLKLPSFPNADRDLLDQYVRAFEKVLSHADQIAKSHADPT
jgi:dTDP-4-amino-4,6-dideoxygalactose transaminase